MINQNPWHAIHHISYRKFKPPITCGWNRRTPMLQTRFAANWAKRQTFGEALKSAQVTKLIIRVRALGRWGGGVKGLRQEGGGHIMTHAVEKRGGEGR